ncbi:MAG: alpha/beta hydrolase [Desulfobacterales bacterium]|nr:alpha/beta hydrolase [Desulfobacterales bacterium]
MQTPTIKKTNTAINEGYTINYKVVGEGKPIVLLFGFGMSLEAWFQFGYADTLSAKYKVIAIDPRGHGKSCSPTASEAYTLKKLSSDIVSVLDQIHVDQAYIYGYSLGAKIALGVAEYYPERLMGLILGGFEVNSNVDLSNGIVISTLRIGRTEWRELWESLMDVPAPMGFRLENVHTSSLIALRTQEAKWGSFKQLLSRIRIPTLLIVAENCFSREDMIQASKILSNAELHIVRGEDHFTLINHMDKAISKIIDFL